MFTNKQLFAVYFVQLCVCMCLRCVHACVSVYHRGWVCNVICILTVAPLSVSPDCPSHQKPLSSSLRL